MLDKFDYAEPRCPLSGGRDFYYPDQNSPSEQIPVGRIIVRADALFNKNEYAEAGKLLEYWRNEARSSSDKGGELAMESELIGYYRKTGDKENCLSSCKNAQRLAEDLGQCDFASGATVLINCATAYKEFGMPKDALPLYLRAEDIYKRTLSKKDPRFGGLYNNMAVTLASLEKYEEAENSFFAALEIAKNSENGELESAVTYVNMAHMYEQMQRLDMCCECMKIAYKFLVSKKVKRNGYCAFVYEKCAPSFAYFGDDETAQRLEKEAKLIYEGA